MEQYSLVGLDTPLISNLNMVENIALIDEVHNNISVKVAQEKAIIYLSKINKQDIAYFRTHQCSELDIFYTMIIRALMTKENTIVILNPLSIFKHTEFMAIAMKNLGVLNDKKNIIILDNDINRFHYEGMLVFNEVL